MTNIIEISQKLKNMPQISVWAEFTQLSIENNSINLGQVNYFFKISQGISK
jgi:hypothetical protein